jgi:hypothetical protein
MIFFSSRGSLIPRLLVPFGVFFQRRTLESCVSTLMIGAASSAERKMACTVATGCVQSVASGFRIDCYGAFRKEV